LIAAAILPTLPPIALDLRSFGAEVRVLYSLPILARNALTVGSQVRLSINDNNFLGPTGRLQLLAGVFAEDSYRPIQPLILTAGLRLDTREFMDGRPFRYIAFSPRGSVVWLINEQHSLRLEYAADFARRQASSAPS